MSFSTGLPPFHAPKVRPFSVGASPYPTPRYQPPSLSPATDKPESICPAGNRRKALVCPHKSSEATAQAAAVTLTQTAAIQPEQADATSPACTSSLATETPGVVTAVGTQLPVVPFGSLLFQGSSLPYKITDAQTDLPIPGLRAAYVPPQLGNSTKSSEDAGLLGGAAQNHAAAADGTDHGKHRLNWNLLQTHIHTSGTWSCTDRTLPVQAKHTSISIKS